MKAKRTEIESHNESDWWKVFIFSFLILSIPMCYFYIGVYAITGLGGGIKHFTTSLYFLSGLPFLLLLMNFSWLNRIKFQYGIVLSTVFTCILTCLSMYLIWSIISLFRP